MYVNCTASSSIFQIDLNTKIVSTIAGIGRQGNDKEGGKSGLEQEISSPWDITVGPSPGKFMPIFRSLPYFLAFNL